MSENNTNKHSEADLAHFDAMTFDAMTDDMIDTSDIPPLSNEFFQKATWRMPAPTAEVTVAIEPEVLAWFKTQENYQQRLTAALRLYAEAHRSMAKEYAAG